MTTATKRRMAMGALVLLALWVPSHHVTTRLSGADPWKFFGWAMYTVPNSTVTVRANPLRGQERIPRLLSPDALAILETYAKRRAVWGKLISPEAMAGRILEHESDLDGLEVILRDWRVDTADARWTFDEQILTYHR